MDLRTFAFAFAFEPRLRNRLLPLPLLCFTECKIGLLLSVALGPALCWEGAAVGMGPTGMQQDADVVRDGQLVAQVRTWMVCYSCGHEQQEAQRVRIVWERGRTAPIFI